MDDLEFRRRILSDPKQKDEEILQALAASDANSKFVDDVLDLDAKIKQAMNVDVPEDLADKILFNQTSSALDEKVVKPNFVRKAMALAASVPLRQVYWWGKSTGVTFWCLLRKPVSQIQLLNMSFMKRHLYAI